jgi:hypothetical protein
MVNVIAVLDAIAAAVRLVTTIGHTSTQVFSSGVGSLREMMTKPSVARSRASHASSSTSSMRCAW